MIFEAKNAWFTRKPHILEVDSSIHIPIKRSLFILLLFPFLFGWEFVNITDPIKYIVSQKYDILPANYLCLLQLDIFNP